MSERLSRQEDRDGAVVSLTETNVYVDEEGRHFGEDWLPELVPDERDEDE